MSKQKSLNNKGFSLVELIIVIAIMAILIGVLAPNMLRYVERTNVSADKQLADTVRSAFITAMMDPTVMQDADYEDDRSIFENTTPASLADLTTTAGAFGDAIRETLTGAPDNTVDDEWISAQLRSRGATDVTVEIIGNGVRVTIPGSDETGGNGGSPITVGP